MLERVAATISRYNMLAPGDRVGVAVSGGADSVFLLHALHALAPRWNLSLVAVHLNHLLRGTQSDADQRFVTELAGSLSVPIVSESADVSSIPGNLEDAGRQARRRLFARLIAESTVTKVATGHTRSDQAETVLYRVLRGTATTGLRGILPITREGLIRPLLDCDRAEIEMWLTDRRHDWRDDHTNRDSRFIRNRIRHCLLPQLEREYNHSLRSVLSHLAQVTQDEEVYWLQEVGRHVSGWSVRNGQSVILEAGRLAAAPPALARRIVRHIIEEVKGNRHRVDFEHIEAVLRLCTRPEGDGSVDLPGLTVERSFHWLRFALADRAKNWLRFALHVAVPGTTHLPDGSLLRTETLTPEHRYNEGNTDCVDAALTRGSLSVRSWQPGDRLQCDAGRLRKLKDLFQQARIPHWDRQGWPVVTDGEKIIWTPKFGACFASRPSEHTRKLVCFLWEKAHGESNISGPASNL